MQKQGIEERETEEREREKRFLDGRHSVATSVLDALSHHFDAAAGEMLFVVAVAAGK